MRAACGHNDPDASVSVTVEGKTVEKAQNQPVTASRIKAGMQKTGGTDFEIHAHCEADENAFVAMSDLNNLRREAMEKYRQALCERYRRNRRL